MNAPSGPRVAVVGGGITGLVAARSVAATGGDVVLFEAADRLGGKIQATSIGDLQIDAGPDSFLARDPWAVELCESLGLGEQLVAPAIFGAYIWSAGTLRKLPSGFPYGLPVSPLAARRAGLLTSRGTLRAAADVVLPGPLRGRDVSIGDFVRYRFGREALERVVDPLLAGTRAGRPGAMSLAAAAPPLDALARDHGSVIRGVRRARRSGQLEAGPPPFLSLRGGMTLLVERLRDELATNIDIRTGTSVVGIERAGDHYQVATHTEPESVDGIVLAVPAFAAAQLLAALNGSAAHYLRQIEYASVAVVTLLLPPRAFTPPPGGSGFLVPGGEGRTVAACTWFSTKWPHAAPDDGRMIVRAFVGRAADETSFDLGDDELVRRVSHELAQALGGTARAETAAVVRFPRGLPQYRVGHLEHIEHVERLLGPETIAVAGAGYRGSGLPDCIRQGRAATQKVLRSLEQHRR